MTKKKKTRSGGSNGSHLGGCLDQIKTLKRRVHSKAYWYELVYLCVYILSLDCNYNHC